MLDPNEYVAEDDDEVAGSFTIRTSSRRMILSLIELFENDSYGTRALLGAITKRQEEVEGLCEQGFPQWYEI